MTRPDGRFHDVDNLSCCDGSVFPTGGSNPILTIVAVALRIAHALGGTSPARYGPGRHGRTGCA